MSLTATQIISLSAVFVGILMVLESFIIVSSKGVDVNGELPFMVFGTLFAAGMPVVLQILGPWGKSWYWYIFIAFLVISGFMSYLRGRGFLIRIFQGNLKNALNGLERALKQAGLTYQKESKETKQGTDIHFVISDGKYPIIVSEKPDSLLAEAYIEVSAPEALWNKELQHELMVFVNLSRRNRKSSDVMKGFRKKIIVGVLTVFLGAYLFGLAKL